VTSRLNPYLTFTGEARAAMEFYQSVLGGELVVSTFGDFGQDDPAIAALVMHSQLETPLGFTLMAADSPDGRGPGVDVGPAWVSLSGDDGDALRGYFADLGEGGREITPLAVQMWGDEFGQLVDRFGTCWLVNISQTA
jgi:PhnB protein